MCTFEHNIILKDELITINTENDETIYLTPCNKKLIQSYCSNDALICLKGNQRQSTINLGTYFEVIQDEDRPKKYLLKAESNVPCAADPEVKYTTYISFEDELSKPRLLSTGNDCEYHIKMTDPSYAPSCMHRVNGHLLDFRKLTSDITVKDGNDTFIFNLCKPARGCSGTNVASCVSGLRNEVLGDTTTRRIAYDDKNGEIEFNFYHGPKRSRLFTKVKLICNWEAKYISNPKRLDVPGKTTKFTVESPLGCVKLPMDCKFRDYGNYEYDLSDLYRKNNAWTVESDKKSIQINICGRFDKVQGICKDKYSQVCENLGKNNQLSYGSILAADRPVNNDVIKAKLVHGSVCPKNTSLNLQTDLIFKCSNNEKGPKLFNTTDCSIEILWETRKACPNKIDVSSNLTIRDRLGQRNLNDLCTGDKTHRLSPTSYIIYNLCTPLQKPCNNTDNVSACLYINKKPAILGLHKHAKLFSRNGILSMEFVGEGCKRLNVYFVCDFGASTTGKIEVKTKTDNCVYDMLINAPAACTSKANMDMENCILNTDTSQYNLSALALVDKNYEYSANDVDYVINVCNALVTNEKALMMQNVSASIYNKTEPNIKRRFFAIGTQSQNLEIKNGKLALKFENGGLCPTTKRYSAGVIYFSCSNRESGPILSSVNDCNYEFNWETKKACPKVIKKSTRSILKCVIPSGELNLTATFNPKFQIPNKDDYNFTFNICEENYTKINKDGRKEILDSSRTSSGNTLLYVTNEMCKKEIHRDWNVINVTFICNETVADVSYEITSVENCTVHIKSESVQFCVKLNQKEYRAEYSAERVTEDVYHTIEYKEGIRTKAGERFQYNTETHAEAVKERYLACKIEVGSIEINDLPYVSILSHQNNRYTIGRNNLNNCEGFICRNSTSIVPRLQSLTACPVISKENSEVKVFFNNTRTEVGLYNTTVIFKCNFTTDYLRILEENINSVTIYYPTDKLCIVQQSSISLIVGLTVAILIILIIAIGVVYAKNKDWFRYMLLRRHDDDKTNLHIYCKNASL